MPEEQVLTLTELPVDGKKTVTLGETKILLVRTGDAGDGNTTLYALEAECPHAKAPLEKGAVCNGRLVCPYHTGTFSLETGAVLEPPPLRDLKRFPLRLEGDAIFVDPTPLQSERPDPEGKGKHLVFAGGGTATAAALAYLRDQAFAGRITVVEPVSEEPVDRTQLTKMALSGKAPLDSLPLFKGKAEASNGSLQALDMEWVRSRVKTLHREERRLELEDGSEVDYDALLLATGGKPKRPPIDGADLPHVFTIRHPEDLQRMDTVLRPGARVTLIGDSFIAFEAASALRQRGLHTTVIAQSKLPFAKKFGEDVAEAMMQLHRSQGVVVHTETEATGITPVSVQLSSGGEEPADVVILAVGVEPVTAYADDLPAGEKGGFAVGRNLRLAPNLWCAGDIASVDGVRIEHWRLAEQHGRTAAQAMYAYATGNAHGPAYPFNGVPFFWTFHFGKRFNYAGHADTWDSIDTEGDVKSLQFVSLYVKDGVVAAALGCGRDTAIAALMEPMRESLTKERAKEIIAAA